MAVVLLDLSQVVSGVLAGVGRHVYAVHLAVIAVTRGFLAGGVITNVMREELPKERKAEFRPFALGSVLYGGLLILL